MSEGKSARHLLRQETSDLHAELDGILSHTDFDDHRSYAGFLERQAGPLFAIEQHIDDSEFAREIGDWSERRRSAALRSDLAALDRPFKRPMLSVSLVSHDHLWGAFYVLEGSRLGAKYLVRRARASRDPAVRSATSYLAHGEGRPLWPTFLAMLGDHEHRGLATTDLIEGARRAFALFIDAAKAKQAV